jgi:hypothetical protein
MKAAITHGKSPQADWSGSGDPHCDKVQFAE